MPDFQGIYAPNQLSGVARPGQAEFKWSLSFTGSAALGVPISQLLNQNFHFHWKYGMFGELVPQTFPVQSIPNLEHPMFQFLLCCEVCTSRKGKLICTYNINIMYLNKSTNRYCEKKSKNFSGLGILRSLNEWHQCLCLVF